VFPERHAEFVTRLTERVTADAAGLGNLLSCDFGTDAALCKAHLFDFVTDPSCVAQRGCASLWAPLRCPRLRATAPLTWSS
jgi:hypothetical protein